MRKARFRRERCSFLDIHLGFKRARARELATFLRSVDAETIVLAGDIVDHLNLAQRVFWNDEHTQVVRTLLAKRRAGARLIYIPGNHDSDLSLVAELLSGQVEVHREWVHRTARGERLLVVHGDQFDGHMEHACPRWMSWLGNALYDFTVMANDRVNDVGRVLGQPYWPLAEKLKLSVGGALRYIERYEQVAAALCRRSTVSTGFCAATSTAPTCGTSARRSTATPAIGSKPAPRIVEEPGGELRLRRWSHAAQPHVDHGSVMVGAGRAQAFGYDRLRLSVDRALHAPE